MRRAIKFRKILFHAPTPKRSSVLLFFLGFVYSFLAVALKIFYYRTTLLSWIISYTVFVLPAIVYAVISNKVVQNFYKRRSFLLSLLNQALLFFGLVLSFLSMKLLLFFVSFSYSINVLSLIGVSGDKGPKNLLYPLIYFAPVLYVLNYYGIFAFGPLRASFFFGLGIAVFLSIYLADYYFRLGISDVSAVKIFSSFLNKELMSIVHGAEINTIHQNLVFNIDGREYEIMLPWLHPGPVRYIGGGSVSTTLIDELNKEGKGYFWHVPSCHKEDPANPQISDRILDQVSEEIEYQNKATKLLKKESGSFKVYGQKFGEFYIVFVDAEGTDDFENTIFKRIKEERDEKIVFVDLHNHPPLTNDKILLEDEAGANKLQELIHTLLNDLNRKEKYDLKASFQISEEKKFMVLLEEISDETYLFITLDTNGISNRLKEKLNILARGNEFDETLILTTDAHQSIRFLSEEAKIESDKIEDSVKEALETLKSAEVGISEAELKNIQVLGNDSYHLQTSVNFVIHLFPMFLFFIYILFILPLLLC